MKKSFFFASSLLAIAMGAQARAVDCKMDTLDVLAYSLANGRSGLQLAVKDSLNNWIPIPIGSLVNSDFGPWGSHKTMFDPELEWSAEGGWKLTWVADTTYGVTAQAQSPDLLRWSPQTYTEGFPSRDKCQVFIVDGKEVKGNIVEMPGFQVRALEYEGQLRKEKSELYAEKMKDDPSRFAGLEDLTFTIIPDVNGKKSISDKLVGIFFEDINYAADGGLYAELVQNRDFEYVPSDRNNDPKWNSLTAWNIVDGLGSASIETSSPIHPNNPHYLAVDAEKGWSISNEGYDGIPVKAKEKYDASIMLRGKCDLILELISANGDVLASAKVKCNSKDWQKKNVTLVPNQNDNAAKLSLRALKSGKFDVDMVSLFPQNTFKGRTNGLRADLAQTLADLHPRFVRFPGGCVAHGDGIDNIYDWKGSIGPLEARKPLRNIWKYHQTRGLGYHEYFLFCEDIGAEPLPVLAAGVPCQNSGTAAHHSHNGITTKGQQCGIPMEEMDAYVQDILDLIEYANGPVTSEWGAKRAEAGHPEPFNLKFLGIGNEDMITEVFVTRFKMIYDAVKKAYPEIEVVGTVGPFYEGTDYDEGWKLAHELEIPYVDEHYYVSPGWLIYNQDYYDKYDRNAGPTKVYLGEWASHLPGRPSNLETALSEALYMTALERNADIVALSSYAPLLSKDNHTQWRPDLIYFNNTEIHPSVDYYVQLLYGQNDGDSYIPASATLSTENEKAKVRVGESIVCDSKTGDYIIKLANLLPVKVVPQLNLSSLGIAGGSQVEAKVISGTPTDNKLVPVDVEASIAKEGNLEYEMPPYSFTVIRVPAK